MAGAFVEGYQGETLSGMPHEQVPEGGRDRQALRAQQRRGLPQPRSSDTNDEDLRDYYTAQFRSLVENAHVNGIMTSYNAINGTPAVADTYTVNELAAAHVWVRRLHDVRLRRGRHDLPGPPERP